MVKIWKDIYSVSFKCHSWCCALFWQINLTVNDIGINHHAHTVCIKETTFNINDCLTIPSHNKVLFFRNCGNHYRVNIFLVTFSDKSINIFGTNHNSHPFLWFRNGNFSSVKPLVFKWYFIQINFKTVSQFTNSHTDAASTKVIWFLDETSDITIAEKTLNFTFFNGIPFLNFCASCFNRFNGLNLRWSCGSTDTVTACFTTEKNNHITSFWFLTNNISFRSCTDNGTEFHTFSDESWVEIFFNISCGKTDLVTIWRITMCRCFRNHLLRQFTKTCFWNWSCNIASSWNTHCLINIRTSWQWVADCTTDTGRGTTKWFNFRWVIVCFILEHQKPWFFNTVHINFNFNRTCVNFVWHFHIVQATILTFITTKDCRHVHQCLWFFRTSKFITHSNIFIISCL